MKKSTILVVGVLAVGGFLVYRRFAGGTSGAAPVKQSPTQPSEDKSPLDTLKGLAGDAAGIVGAGKDLLAGLGGLFGGGGNGVKQSPTQPSGEPSPLDRLKAMGMG